MSLSNGDLKKVKIQAFSEEPVVALQIGLEFPSEVADVFNVAGGNSTIPFSADNFNLVDPNLLASKGHVNHIWYSETGTPIDINGKTLFEFQLEADNTIANLQNSLLVDHETLPTKFFNADGEEVPVTLKMIVEDAKGLRGSSRSDNSTLASISRLNIAPNPASDFAEVSFDLKRDQTVAVEVYDVNGKVVFRQVSDLKSGLQLVKMEGLRALPNGLYNCSILTEEGRLNNKLVLQK